jgi:hypothetical protein
MASGFSGLGRSTVCPHLISCSFSTQSFLLDVEEIPSSGVWFQLITKDATKINDGPSGLQRLDTVLRLAKKHNIYVSLTLTNNWNPIGRTTPRNTLGNDYGRYHVDT